MQTPFQRHSRALASALALAERIYVGAMGDTIAPAESRMALDPLDVLYDIADVLRACEAEFKLEVAERLEDEVEL